MAQNRVDRRAFLIAGGAVGAASAASAAEPAPPPAPAPAPAAAPPAGYVFLKPAEALFVEALVTHMIPADELTPDGVSLGVATFIDRALAGGWGKGDRLYLQGPWKPG